MAFWDADPIVEDTAKPSKEGEWWKNDPVVDSGKSPASSATSSVVNPVWAGAGLSDYKQVARNLFDFPAQAAVAAGTTLTGAPYWPTQEEVEKPIISPETVKGIQQWLGGVSKPAFDAIGVNPQSTTTKIVSGAGEGLADAVAGFTSPTNLALLPLGAGKTAVKLLGTVFAAKAAADTPEQWKAFNETDDPAQKSKIAVQTLTSLGLPLAAFLHGGEAKGGEVPKEPGQSPESAPADESRQQSAETEPTVATTTKSQSIPTSVVTEFARLPDKLVEVRPTQPEITPPEPIPSTPKTQGIGITSAFSDLGKGVSDNFYAAAFDSLQKGKDTISGVRDPILARAKPFYDAGLITSPEDFKSIVQSGEINKSVPNVQAPSVPLRTEEQPAIPVFREAEKSLGEKEAQAESVDVSGQNRPEPTSTGVANRVLEEEAKAGRIDPIESGEGMSWQEMVDLGRQEINAGADPQMIARRFQRTKRISPTDFAVLRAERERLAVETNKAEDAVRANPSDPVAREAYNQTRKTEVDWIQKIVQPAKTSTSDIFRGMQGEAPIDASTFAGLRRAVLDEKGREIKPHEVPQLEQVASKVQRATQAEAVARKRLSDAVKQITKDSAPKTADELRAHFAERIRRLTPC